MSKILFLIAIVFAFLAEGTSVRAQTTAFTYQGSLQVSGSPTTDSYDFQFALFDAVRIGTQLGPTVSVNRVAITNGVFSVSLDFGSQFPGADRYLEIRVRQTGGGSYTTLSPRQQIYSSPYSIKTLTADTAANATNATTANNALNLGGVAAANYLQTTGNGSGLTSLNASNVSTGTLSNARTTGSSVNTPATLVLRDASGGFSAGTITANSIAVPPTTRTISIPPAGFVPTTPPGSLADLYRQTPNYIASCVGTESQYVPPINSFTAAVYLPDGATITEVRGYAQDQEGGQDATFTLYSKLHTSFTANALGAAATTGSSPTVQQVVLPITPFVVDNTTTSYQIEVSWLSSGPNCDERIKFVAARVTYTVTSPLP